MTDENFQALLEAAREIERRLICCDVYERLTAKGRWNWTRRDRREKRRHADCYAAGEARAIVLEPLLPSTHEHRMVLSPALEGCTCGWKPPRGTVPIPAFDQHLRDLLIPSQERSG